MTEKEALLWVLGVLGSLCAAAITIDKVLEIIHKYIKKAQEPDNEQNKRLDGSRASFSTRRPSPVTSAALTKSTK